MAWFINLTVGQLFMRAYKRDNSVIDIREYIDCSLAWPACLVLLKMSIHHTAVAVSRRKGEQLF
jgi:hypothetical protein